MLHRCNYLRIAAAAVVLCPVLVLARLWWPSDPPPENTNPPPAMQPPSDWAAYQHTVEPFFAKHCLECHDETTRGGVRLDAFADRAAPVKGPPKLENDA